MKAIHLVSDVPCSKITRWGDTVSQKYTEARRDGNRRWDAANLDRLSIAMPKGKKELIRAHSEARGESMNAFVNRAVDETMERDNATHGAE